MANVLANAFLQQQHAQVSMFLSRLCRISARSHVLFDLNKKLSCPKWAATILQMGCSGLFFESNPLRNCPLMHLLMLLTFLRNMNCIVCRKFLPTPRIAIIGILICRAPMLNPKPYTLWLGSSIHAHHHFQHVFYDF